MIHVGELLNLEAEGSDDGSEDIASETASDVEFVRSDDKASGNEINYNVIDNEREEDEELELSQMQACESDGEEDMQAALPVEPLLPTHGSRTDIPYMLSGEACPRLEELFCLTYTRFKEQTPDLTIEKYKEIFYPLMLSKYHLSEEHQLHHCGLPPECEGKTLQECLAWLSSHYPIPFLYLRSRYIAIANVTVPYVNR